MERTRLDGGHHYHFTVTVYLSEELYMPHLVRPEGDSPYVSVPDPSAYCDEAIKATCDALAAIRLFGAQGWRIRVKGPDWTEYVAEMKWTAHNARAAIEQMVMGNMPGRHVCNFHIQPKNPYLHRPVLFEYEDCGLFAYASEEVLAEHYRQDFYPNWHK